MQRCALAYCLCILPHFQTALYSPAPSSGCSVTLLQEATKALMTTVRSLPELRAQKRKLDGHMNMLYALLTAIKARTLDKYHELAQSLLAGAPQRFMWLPIVPSAGSFQSLLRYNDFRLVVRHFLQQ